MFVVRQDEDSTVRSCKSTFDQILFVLAHTVCFVGALCTELEKRGLQHMFRVYTGTLCGNCTHSCFQSLTLSRGSNIRVQELWY